MKNIEKMNLYLIIVNFIVFLIYILKPNLNTNLIEEVFSKNFMLLFYLFE